MAVLPIWFMIVAFVGLLILVGGPIVVLLATSGPERRRAIKVAAAILSAVLVAIGVTLSVIVGYSTVRIEQVAQHERMIQLQEADVARARERALMLENFESSRRDSSPAEVLDYRGAIPLESEEPTAVEEGSPELESFSQFVVYRGDNATGETVDAIPGWAAETPRLDGIEWNNTRVLASQPWATIEEAENELAQRTTHELAAYFRHVSPDVSSFVIPRSLVEDTGVVSRRCHVTESLKVGEYEEPIYRVFWELDYDDNVAQVLQTSWEQQTIRQRLTWLAGGVGLLTILLGAFGAYSRLNAATDGRYQGRLRLATGALCFAVGLVVTMLA